MNNPFHRVARTSMLAGLPREVGVIAAIAFFVALGFGIVAPALPIYATTFGVSAFLAAAVISTFALMRFVSSPFAGWLVDRVGERSVLTTGLVIVAVSSVFAGLAQSYPQLLVLRGIGGIGSSMFTVSAMAMLLKVVGPHMRGRAAGSFQAGFLLGAVAGPAVGGLVVGISIRAPFFLYAGTLAVAAFVSWTYLPAEPPGQPIETTETIHDPDPDPASDDESTPTAEVPGASGAAPRRAPTLGEALRMRAYRAALSANLTNGMVTYGLRSSLVPLFVVSGLHADPSLSGIGFLFTAATEAVLLLPAGRLADQRGRRPAMLLGTSLTMLATLGLAVSGVVWAFLLAMAITGLAAAFMGSAPAAVAGDVVGPGGRGIVIAAYQMTADLGTVIGPLLAGFLADMFGFGPAFVVGAGFAGIALVFAVLMPETLPRAAAGQRTGGSA